MPLSVIRGEAAPGALWRDTDRLLFLALEKYERGIHPKCGQPLIYSTDPDARGHYTRHTTTCFACLEQDKADRAATNADRRTPPGQIDWISPDVAVRHAMEYPLPEQYGDPPAT